MKPKKKTGSAGRRGKRNRQLRMTRLDPVPADKPPEGGENATAPVRDANGTEIPRASFYSGPGSFGDVLGCGLGDGPVISDGHDIMVAYNDFEKPRRIGMRDEDGSGEPMFEVGPSAKRNSFVGNTSYGGSGMIGRVHGEDSHFEGNTAISDRAINALLSEIRRTSDELEARGELSKEAKCALREVLASQSLAKMYHNAGTAASLVSAVPTLSVLLHKLIELLPK